MYRLAPLRRSAASAVATRAPRGAVASSVECRLRPHPLSTASAQRWRSPCTPQALSSAAAQQQADPPKKGGSNPAGNNAARDTRLAGRRRFYRVVGIAPASPPWEHFDDADGKTVDNPVSAGVDGTQSASGVSTKKAATGNSMRRMLTPNPTDDDTDNDDTSKCQWYGVTLDGRTVRTPLGTPLTVPSPSLALAIASEWDAQIETIKPAQMPLTTLACTALDQISAHPTGADTARDNVLRYLRNDTTCYLTDPAEDRVLYKRQIKAWDELHNWATEHLGGVPPTRAVGNDEGLVMSRARKSKPNAGLPHPDILVTEAEMWVTSLDAWRLAALQAVTTEAKSFLVGMAVVRGAEGGAVESLSSSSEGKEGGDEAEKADEEASESRSQPPPYTETKDAVEASRVEEEFQIENWGLVEGGHDYDRLNCSVSVHSAAVMVGSIASSSSFAV